jgi:hypothetical protein
MNSRIIIIAILIFIKVIGIASRARAESIYSLDCSSNYSVKKINYQFWKPTYRCGKSPSIIMGGLRG